LWVCLFACLLVSLWVCWFYSVRVLFCERSSSFFVISRCLHEFAWHVERCLSFSSSLCMIAYLFLFSFARSHGRENPTRESWGGPMAQWVWW
jgi:hypothetical protein